MPVAALFSADGVQPAQDRGMRPNSIYNVSGLDRVNMSNGNLTLDIPLGLTFPVAGNFSYGFQLNYNSNSWDWVKTACDAADPAQVFLDFQMAIPSVTDNAGLGWRVSLGELIPGGALPSASTPGTVWVYVGPDGGRHAIFNQLHPPVSTGPLPLTPEDYTTDGTFLRLTSLPSPCHQATPTQASCQLLLEFPDGTYQLFEKIGNDPKTRWLPTSISDPFGNQVQISYSATTWTVTDPHGRQHTIVFQGPNWAYQRVHQVNVERFGSNQKATYAFQYTNNSVERHQLWQYFLDSHCAALPDEATERLDLDLLTRLVLPDGSYFEMTYFTEERFLSAIGAKAGGLHELRLPTGIWNRFTYTSLYTFGATSPGGGPDPVQKSFGVRTKEIFERGSSGTETGLGSWQYSPRRALAEAPGDAANQSEFQPCYHTTKVTNPLGHTEVSYFQNAFIGYAYEQQLPYTRCDPPEHGGAFRTQGPYLSREIFDVGGTLLRSIWVDFVFDTSGHTFERDAQMTTELTIFHDDPVPGAAAPASWNPDALKASFHYTLTTYSDFDGLGHAREMRLESNFPHGRNSKYVDTNYNPNAGQYTYPNGSFTHPSTSAPWILNTYDRVTSEEGVSGDGHRAVSLYCYDPETGFLKARRTQRNQTQLSADDLLEIYTPDAQGNLARREWFGGDGASLPTATNWCATIDSFAGEAQYEVANSWFAGSLQSSDYLDCAGGQFLNITDNTIDYHTGKASASRDASGVEAGYQFDVMGRLVALKPDESAWIYYRYNFPTETSPFAELNIRERRCANGTSSYDTCTGPSRLAESFSFLDRLGRVVQEQRRMPSGSGTAMATRNLSYNILNWPLTVSEWSLPGDGQDGFETQYLNYDRFGRPGIVQRPDGSQIRYAYTGDRVSQTEVDVQVSDSAQQAAVTTGFKDAKGRLTMIDQNAGTNGSLVHTTYLYDEADRLVQVCVDDNNNAVDGCSGQQRLFEFDDRGFLRYEEHPELKSDTDPSINGRINYDYDAMGKATTRSLAGTAFDMTYLYDRAGRLTQTRNASGGLLAEYFFAKSNLGNNRRTGKLQQARYHNRIATPDSNGQIRDVVVTESFAYEELDGRMSEYRARSNEGISFKAEILAYDQLGNITSFDYPRSSGPGSLGNIPNRTVNTNFQSGFPVGVSGFASMTHLAKGSFATIAHANGVADHRELGSASWSPLRRINTTGVTAGGNWDSGVYAYDDALNITAIGAARYRYDLVSRLKSGEVVTASGLRTETLTYDAFGNIKTIQAGTAPALNLTPSTATNRLAAGLAAYDNAGNATSLNLGGIAYQYGYDPENRIASLNGGGQQKRFAYSAGGERVIAYDLANGSASWTLRGPANQVVRRLEFDGSAWNWLEDYVYVGDTRLAAVVPGGSGETVEHFHLDHLGSTRMITNAQGGRVESNDFFPFGGYTQTPLADAEAMQFTGHERDDNGDPAGDLDYMHARYYSPVLGRFLSVDPVLGKVTDSQGWNRYSYVSNRPMIATDPDGREDKVTGIVDDVSATVIDATPLVGTIVGGSLAVNTGVSLGLTAATATAGVVVLTGAFAWQFGRTIDERFMIGKSISNAISSYADASGEMIDTEQLLSSKLELLEKGNEKREKNIEGITRALQYTNLSEDMRKDLQKKLEKTKEEMKKRQEAIKKIREEQKRRKQTRTQSQ